MSELGMMKKERKKGEMAIRSVELADQGEREKEGGGKNKKTPRSCCLLEVTCRGKNCEERRTCDKRQRAINLDIEKWTGSGQRT